MTHTNRKYWAFVGGYGSVIETFSFEPSTGALVSVDLLDGVPESPTFLALDEERKLLFAVSEKAGPDAPEPGRATAFRIDANSGKLTQISDVWSGGSNTVHVIPSNTGGHLFTASSSTAEGRVAVLPLAADGRLSEPSDSQVAGKNAHGLVQSPDGKFVWVVCRGDEFVAQYRFDESAGKLVALSPNGVFLPAPAGPRHIAVHPTHKVVYVLLDWAGAIVSYDYGTNGVLSNPETVSVFPPGKEPSAVTGTMTAAEIEVSRDGKTVYASTRTPQCQSIAILEVNASGRLRLVANEEAGGLVKGPRHFMLSRDNRFMLVANQENNTLLAFAVSPESGLLKLLGPATPTRVKMPNAIAFGAF